MEQTTFSGYHNSTCYVAELFAAINNIDIPSDTANITEVGILLKYNGKYILLAHDTANVPNVHDGDTTTVTEVVFRRPFTYQFAEITSRLLFEAIDSSSEILEVRDMTGSTIRPDFGYDQKDNYCSGYSCYHDYIHEETRMIAGDTPNPQSDMDKYTLGEISVSDDRPSVGIGYNDTCAWINIQTALSISAGTDVTEIGLKLWTDGTYGGTPWPGYYGSDSYNGYWILILYSPLPQPLEGGKVYDSRITLYYCYVGSG